MTTFLVPDLSCGHCVATVTRAVQALDPAARLSADLPAHRLTVHSERLSEAQVKEALVQAGYPPAPAA